MTELHPHAPPPPGIVKVSARTGAILVVFTVVFTAMMAAAYFATKAPIEASAAEEKLNLIGEVLPASSYDNALLQDSIQLPPTPALGLDQPTRAYLARKGGAPVAVVLEAAAPDGYSGRIGLILAVRADGRISAVRVTQHKETPGLGDYIDIHKDKNKAHPWIGQFDAKGFDDVPESDWKVRKDGGRFDAHTGATISARAVTNAVGRALRYVLGHRDQFFAAAPSAAAGKEKS